MAKAEEVEAAPSLDDVTCPICLSVLLEPVTLPCHHSLCLSCFQEHVSLTSLACPMCRTRISVWVRKNSKTNTLVDVKLWKAIQKYYPAQLEARSAGREEGSGTEQEVQRRVSEPGEIRQEYESFLAQETQEASQRKQKEETASIKLIQQLQEEEKKRQQELEQQQHHMAQEDFMLALKLEETEKARVSKQLEELQKLCAEDEDFARQLEVVEGQPALRLSQGKAASGSRGTAAASKGPMDQFLGQKGVSSRHQPPAHVLSSSDTNTVRLQDPSTDIRETATKHSPSHSSESGKENLKARQRGSPIRPGEGSRGRRIGHCPTQGDLQLSPDIDSYSIASRHQEDCGISATPKEESSVNGKEEEAVVQQEEKKGRGSDCSTAHPPADVSLLLRWEKDEESLTDLLIEQQRAEAQLRQELDDRLLAEALQEELNSQNKKVLRTKGSEDEYALRHKRKSAPSSPNQPGPSRRNTKRQATLSEVLCKRHKAV